jgi:hypothetical protein
MPYFKPARLSSLEKRLSLKLDTLAVSLSHSCIVPDHKLDEARKPPEAVVDSCLGRDTPPKVGLGLVMNFGLNCCRCQRSYQVFMLSRICWSLWIVGRWLSLFTRHLGEGLSW